MVAYRTSTDLRTWSERRIAFADPASGTEAGNTESPFILRHNGSWYLFIGPRPDYVGTDVFRSDNPYHFRIDDRVGHIAAHAAEVIDDGDLWITSCGWGQAGVSLAALEIGRTAPKTAP